MKTFTIMASCAFGLESIVAREVRKLGYEELYIENGKVLFEGDWLAVARCNLWLRCADRVYIRMAVFDAVNYDELFDGVKSVPWEDFLPEDAFMHVTGKSVKSGLKSVSDNQAISKKALVVAMQRRYGTERFSESGSRYRIDVSILKDEVTLALDTSGEGLHRRGYRPAYGEAPLRETLAAALVYLSRWTPDRILADPFCGSGTIAIEGAMIGKNMAPGLHREFAAEKWSYVPAGVWEEARTEARGAVRDEKLTILASDHDKKVFRTAQENAARAGVEEDIVFQKKPVQEFRSRKKFGCIICNPPYGERMGDKEEAGELYREMGKVFQDLDSWSLFILSGHPDFEKFYGKRSGKNRKLYNGTIKTYLYQYLGELPGKKQNDTAAHS